MQSHMRFAIGILIVHLTANAFPANAQNLKMSPPGTGHAVTVPTPGGGSVAVPTPGGGSVAVPTPGGGSVAVPTPGGGAVAVPTPGGGQLPRSPLEDIVAKLPQHPSAQQLEDILKARPGPRELLIILAKCAQGSCPDKSLRDTETAMSQKLSEAITKDLKDRLDFWEKHTRYCVGMVAYKTPELPKDVRTAAPFPGKEKADARADDPQAPRVCDDHDMTLFNGLLCYAGDQRGCEAVKNSQVTDEKDETFFGSWWRSPMSIKIDRKIDKTLSASMSEEQTWGVFFYLMKTNDRDAFNRWVNWIGTKNRDSAGLPLWCTDPDPKKPGECNFLPLECVAFEELARRFDPNNPLAAISVSQKVGCDRVMAVTWAGGAGVGGLLVHVPGGLPALLASAPTAIFTDPEVQKILKDALQNPAKAPQLLPDFLIKAAGYLPPDDLGQQLATSGPPAPQGKLCAKVVVEQLKLPWPLGDLNNDFCIVPPPIFEAALPLVPISPVTMRAPGYTTGYPAQMQTLLEAIATAPGYGLHKVGLRIFLLQQLGYGDETLKRAAQRYAEKTSNNAFALYLKGYQADAAAVIKDKCPWTDPQPETRHQWVWERDERLETNLYGSSSYWDCMFAARLLVHKDPSPPPVMVEMQRAQSEAVRVPFTTACEQLETTVNANAQSAKPGDDFQIAFTDPPITNFPEKHWYRGNTFVAPCSGWYLAEISVSGFKAPQDSLKLVRTWRYGMPIDVKDVSKPSLLRLYVDQYDAIGLVLSASNESRSIDGARLTIRWDPTNQPTK